MGLKTPAGKIPSSGPPRMSQTTWFLEMSPLHIAEASPDLVTWRCDTIKTNRNAYLPSGQIRVTSRISTHI